MHPRITLATGNFFFGFSLALAGYVLLPYLTAFMPARYTGLVITTGAALSCIAFFYVPRIVMRIGAQQTAMVTAIVQMFAFFALAARPVGIAAILLIVASVAMQPFLAYSLDLLLEATVAKENTTGRVRTLFLTAWNVAELGAPLLLAALLGSTNEYDRVFLAAGAALVPFIVLFAARKLPTGRPARLVRARDAIKALTRNRDRVAVTTAGFLLSLFYVWAPLYVPLYLHNELGISWTQLGWVFSVILIPFIFIEYPVGIIADTYLGDKEFMTAGFLIMGVAFAAVGFLTSAASIWTILIVLFVSRIGASLVEAMTEAHFFRSVSETDVESIALYRILWPLSNVAAPLVGSALLFIDGFPGLFFAAGTLLAVVGMGASLLIRDFR